MATEYTSSSRLSTGLAPILEEGTRSEDLYDSSEPFAMTPPPPPKPATPAGPERALSTRRLSSHQINSGNGNASVSSHGFDYTGSDDGCDDDSKLMMLSSHNPNKHYNHPNHQWHTMKRRSKMAFLSFLILSAILLPYSIDRIAQRADQQALHTQLATSAAHLTQTVASNLRLAADALQDLSTSISLSAATYGPEGVTYFSPMDAIPHIEWPFTEAADYEQHISNLIQNAKNNQRQQWPFVTLLDFEHMAAPARRVAKSIVITQHPIIETLTERIIWEEQYVTLQDRKWINESIQFQTRHVPVESRSSTTSSNATRTTILDEIMTSAVPSISHYLLNFTTSELLPTNQDGPYLPMWQSSPILTQSSLSYNIVNNEKIPYYHPSTAAGVDGTNKISLYNHDQFFLWDSKLQELLFQQIDNNTSTPPPPMMMVSPIANYHSTGNEMLAQKYSQWIDRYSPDDDYISASAAGGGGASHEPFSFLYYPILEMNDDEDTTIMDDMSNNGGATLPNTTTSTPTPTPNQFKVVGYLSSAFYWKDYLQGSAASHRITENDDAATIKGLIAVLRNECDQVVTYRIDGEDVTYLGMGDLHDPHYDLIQVSSHIFDVSNQQIQLQKETMVNYGTIPFTTNGCATYTLSFYASQEMDDQYQTYWPTIVTICAALALIMMIIAFIGYDRWMEQREQAISRQAMQSSAIVSSLFPKVVRDRLLNPTGKPEDAPLVVDTSLHGSNMNQIQPPASTKLRLKSFLNSGDNVVDDVGDLMNDQTNKRGSTMYGGLSAAQASQPIADLFLETTVMFADIAGFTAWCSVREPPQVFILLESVYGEFDSLAKRRKVFKVETIGDSYVAVTGLPEPLADHAVAMAKFARDCRVAMNDVCTRLEKTLGPDTADLQLRFGLHSGPVTAGVLRGAKGRFQLFGDTVNTASRMESCGTKSKIHISQTTADQLIEAGKSHWITKRQDLVEVKGKGLMQTYWIEPTGQPKSSRRMSSIEMKAATAQVPETRNDRLVDWIVEIMDRLIRKIVARRLSAQSKLRNIGLITDAEFFTLASSAGETVLDEVREIVELPEFDAKALHKQQDPETIELGPEVRKQLQQYVLSIASMYKGNPFHNFEHAAHVTMSVTKLMSRIVAPDLIIEEDYMKKSQSSTDEIGGNNLASTLHDHTYGITSDPLTQFACVFSSLIHDVDHPGVPNSQLAKEDKVLAEVYRGKSIAEQNSVDLAWDLFTSNHFSELRKTICGTEPEIRHFRQLVINSVMATDIMDPDLKKLRNNRWDVAFKYGSKNDTPRDKINRKATIVIEHLIQASDVAHTMQHWHVYRKWNERLFEEMYKAFHDGRAEKDPSEFWYTGEMGFFDFYIIPLAKKLSECGVFGVSSDEYLNYAVRNREEWERRGLEVLEQMVDNMKAKYGTLKRLSIEQKIPPTGKTRISSLINDDDSSSSSDYDSHDNVRND